MMHGKGKGGQYQSGGYGKKSGPPSKRTGKKGAAVVGKTKTMGSGNPSGSFCGVSHGKRPASGPNGNNMV